MILFGLVSQIKSLKLVGPLCLSLALVACATPIASQRSPDGKKSIVVLETRVWFDSTVTVDLVDESSSKRLKRFAGDRKPELVHIVWTPDSNKAAVLVVDGYASDIFFGYDLQRDHELETEEVTASLRNSLIREYGLEEYVRFQPSFDVFAWIKERVYLGEIQMSP